MTYDVTGPGGKLIAERIDGAELNRILLAAPDAELGVRVHAEDHTRRPRRPGDPHTDARPVTGTRLFAGMTYTELHCLWARLTAATSDISCVERNPSLGKIQGDSDLLWHEVHALKPLVSHAERAAAE